MKTVKLQLKDLKDNPYHDGNYDKEQIKKLETSIRNLGVLRSFSAFKKGEKTMLVCGHHTREAARNVLGNNAEVTVTIQEYDDDTAVWGMATENLTQVEDEKKKIKDLVAIRKYLKKTFKNYQEFAEFMRKKGVSVVISDKNSKTSKRGRVNEGRPEGFVIGSSRNISEWLNRKGIIMDFQEISELLRIKDNLSPELYDKMVVGNKHPKKGDEEDEELVFNLTNAKMLSSLGDDHEEQQDILKALENSNEERMHRVRTRGKVITKYKELKKAAKTGKLKIKGKEVKLDEEDKKKIEESIQMVREGKKDIGNIELPNVKLPKAVTEITIQEINSELIDGLDKIAREFELYVDKGNLKNSPDRELNKLLIYLHSWGKDKFISFYKKVLEELAKRKLHKAEEMDYDFEKGLKGGY